MNYRKKKYMVQKRKVKKKINKLVCPCRPVSIVPSPPSSAKSSFAADHVIQSRQPVPSSLVAQSSTVPSSHHTTAIRLSLS